MAITPELQKQIIDWIAVDSGNSLEDFQNNFKKKYDTPENFLESDTFKSKVGKTLGSLTTKIVTFGKEFGVELGNDDIEDIENAQDGSKKRVQKPDKAVQSLLKKMQETANKVISEKENKIKELTTSLTAGNDEKYKAIEGKYNALSTDYETVKEFNQKLKQEKEDLEKSRQEDERNYHTKLNEHERSSKEGDLWKEFPWADEANPYVREGFTATVNKKAKFDLDENKSLVVIDKATGKKFPTPGKNEQFLSPKEFLQNEGIEANKTSPVYKINPAGGQKTEGKQGWLKREPTADPKNKNVIAATASPNFVEQLNNR